MNTVDVFNLLLFIPDPFVWKNLLSLIAPYSISVKPLRDFDRPNKLDPLVVSCYSEIVESGTSMAK
jgi:hypothetical protein